MPATTPAVDDVLRCHTARAELAATAERRAADIARRFADVRTADVRNVRLQPLRRTASYLYGLSLALAAVLLVLTVVGPLVFPGWGIPWSIGVVTAALTAVPTLFFVSWCDRRISGLPDHAERLCRDAIVEHGLEFVDELTTRLPHDSVASLENALTCATPTSH